MTMCLCVMVLAPWSQYSATEYPDDPVPYVDEGGGDVF